MHFLAFIKHSPTVGHLSCHLFHNINNAVLSIHVAYIFVYVSNYFPNSMMKRWRPFLYTAMLSYRKVVLCYTPLAVNKKSHHFSTP